MPKIKASDVCALRGMLRRQPGWADFSMLARLTSEAGKIFQTAVATNWIPDQEESEILSAGAKLLFPDDPRPLRRLGRELAHENLKGIYRIFLRIPTREFIIQRVAQLWNINFEEGMATVANLTANHGTLLVTGYSSLLPEQGEEICGYIEGILDLTGAKQTQASFDGSDPKVLKWNIAWG